MLFLAKTPFRNSLPQYSPCLSDTQQMMPGSNPVRLPFLGFRSSVHLARKFGYGDLVEISNGRQTPSLYMSERLPSNLHTSAFPDMHRLSHAGQPGRHETRSVGLSGK